MDVFSIFLDITFSSHNISKNVTTRFYFMSSRELSLSSLYLFVEAFTVYFLGVPEDGWCGYQLMLMTLLEHIVDMGGGLSTYACINISFLFLQSLKISQSRLNSLNRVVSMNTCSPKNSCAAI